MLPEIPDYTLKDLIGSGGYGDVYLAINSTTKLECAVKVVRRSRFENDEPYENELSAVRRYHRISLSNPTLLTIRHVGQEEGVSFYYAMDLADAEGNGAYRPHTLQDDLDRKGRLTVRQSVKITNALLKALHDLHRASLIHRDIKPANVIFIHGKPVLADIGLMTVSGVGLTQLGTPGYVPPEGTGKPAADIYAMGMMLYRMCTGHTCADYPSPPGLSRKDERANFARINPVILRACAASPEERYHSASSMHTALERRLNPPEKKPKPKPRRRKKAVKPVVIENKREFKRHLRQLVEEQVAAIRKGYPLDQQYLTVDELRVVTRRITKEVRALVGWVPDEFTQAGCLALAVLEPDKQERKALLQEVFYIGEEGTTVSASAWAINMQAATLTALDDWYVSIAGRLTIRWYVTRFGFLQKYPDDATALALDFFQTGLNEAIDENWADIRSALG